MKSTRKIVVGDKAIGYGKPIFIIAEAGVNHNGELAKALQLVDIAAEAGADAVKFQTFRAGQVVIESGEPAESTGNAPRAGVERRILSTNNGSLSRKRDYLFLCAPWRKSKRGFS